MPHCYFCKRALTMSEADEFWCHGCSTYICDDCDEEGPEAVGKHVPEDHLDIDDYEDDE